MSESTGKPVYSAVRPWLAYLVFVAVAVAVYFLLAGTIQAVLYNLIGFVMMAVIFTGIRWHRPVNSLPWYIIAFGLGLYVVGDVVFFNLYPNLLGEPTPLPSVADALYLSSYPVVTFGMALLIRRQGRRNYSAAIDAAIIAIGTGLLVWVLLAEPYASDPSLTVLIRLVSIAYPFMSVLWVAMAMRFAFTPAVRLPAFRLLIAAVLLHPVADFIYSWLLLNGTYSADHVVNAGWLLSYGFFGAAALHPSMRELYVDTAGQESSNSGWRIAVLGVAAMMVPVVFVLDALLGGSHVDVVIAGGSTILLLLVLVRMWGLLRENERTSTEIGELNEVLERRVEERTAELEGQATSLQRSEARLSDAQRMAHLGSWEWNITTGEVTWSDEVFRIYGYEPHAFVPTLERLKEIVHPDDRGAFSEAIEGTLYRNEPYDHHHRIVQPDGAERVVHRRARVVLGEEGNPLRMIGTVQDITERRLAEEELERSREAAEAASRAKSDFLANMSHEIRTPMNGVIGMTGLLLDTELDEEQREYAQTVRTSGENLLTIINDILDFSKIEAGKIDIEVIDFDLRSAVEETVELLAERAYDKGLEIASLVKYDAPTALRGDPGRIRQILVNLLGNAVKFTEEGEVTLIVRLVEDAEAAAVMSFEVKDTGIGMTEEQRSRLFQSFTQVV